MTFVLYYNSGGGVLLKRRKTKAVDVILKVRKAVASGNYIYSQHGGSRRSQRGISDGDFRHAVANGWHEKKKDEWKPEFHDWNYAIRGNSLEGDRLRVAVAIEEIGDVEVVVVTVINLDDGE